MDYPEFRRIDDNSIIKPAFTCHSGAQAAETSSNHRFHRLIVVLRFALVAGLVLLACGLSCVEVNLIIVIAASMVVMLNYILWGAGRRKAKRMLMAKTGGVLHEAIEVSLLSIIVFSLFI